MNRMASVTDPLLYRPLKLLGLITDAAPFAINRLGDNVFITVAVGNVFQVFNLDKLSLCIVSRPAETDISFIEVYNHYTFCAVNNAIHIYLRTKIVETLRLYSCKITSLLMIGHLLLSIDCENHCKIYDAKAKAFVQEFQVLNKSAISSVFHPYTYLNKVVFGFQDGTLELWNIRTKKHLHAFKSHLKCTKSDTLTCVDQSSAADVVAVGFESGDIVVMNLRLDIVLFHFKQKGGVTSISFRSDGVTQDTPYLASTSNTGSIYFWQISAQGEENEEEGAMKGRLIDTVKHAHQRKISKVHFIHGEPLLISSGLDNVLKVWVFDSQNSPCRLLRQRQGFASPPTRLKSYSGSVTGESDYDGIEELIASEAIGGVLRSCRISAPHLLSEFSGANLPQTSALSTCIDFDFSGADNDWANMASIHENSSTAYLWSIKDKAGARTALKRSAEAEKKDLGYKDHPFAATSLAVSSCGNFCVVGYKDGFISRYNMQSGMSRGSYPKEGDAAEVLSGHTASVNGIFMDMANLVLVSIGSDKKIIFWSFIKHTKVSEENFASNPLMLRGNRETGLVAVADEKCAVRLYDVQTRRLCRLFPSPTQKRITDMVLTNDCRRLLCAGLDGTIRVWEISTSRCLNYVSLPTPIRSLCILRNGDLLIAEEGSRYVRACFDASLTETIPIWREASYPIPLISNYLEESSSRIDRIVVPPANVNEMTLESILDSNKKKMSLYQSLRISNLPKLMWISLFQSTSMKYKSDIKVPVVKQNIPFHLQAVGDIQGRIVFDAAPKSTEDGKSIDKQDTPAQSKLLSRRRKSDLHSISSHASKFAVLLKEFRDAEEAAVRAEVAQKFIMLCMTLTPQEVEQECRRICRHEADLEGYYLLASLLEVLSLLIGRGDYFEFLQGLIHFALYSQGERIRQCYIMKPFLDNLNKALHARSEEMRCYVSAALCYLKIMLNNPLM